MASWGNGPARIKYYIYACNPSTTYPFNTLHDFIPCQSSWLLQTYKWPVINHLWSGEKERAKKREEEGNKLSFSLFQKKKKLIFSHLKKSVSNFTNNLTRLEDLYTLASCTHLAQVFKTSSHIYLLYI